MTTVTYNRKAIERPTGNIYKAISIVAKRSIQVNASIKKELVTKLQEFGLSDEGIEEVFENREQIEVSKFYERLPKAHSIALKEWLYGMVDYKIIDDQD